MNRDHSAGLYLHPLLGGELVSTVRHEWQENCMCIYYLG